MKISQLLCGSILCATLILSGCKKEEVVISSEDQESFLIDSLVYRDNFNENPRVFTASFEYDSDKRVTFFQDERPGYFDGELKYNETGQLDSIINVFDILSTKFSVLSYENGRLTSRIDSENGGFVGLIEWRYEFEYNSNGQLKEKTTTYSRNEDFMSVTKYSWKDGNLDSADNFGSDGELISTTEFTYDDKPNYARNHPHFIGDPLYWNENNVTRSVLTDFSGLIDAFCLDCSLEYEYDGEGRPTEIRTDWMSSTEIYYQ